MSPKNIREILNKNIKKSFKAFNYRKKIYVVFEIFYHEQRTEVLENIKDDAYLCSHRTQCIKGIKSIDNPCKIFFF